MGIEVLAAAAVASNPSAATALADGAFGVADEALPGRPAPPSSGAEYRSPVAPERGT